MRYRCLSISSVRQALRSIVPMLLPMSGRVNVPDGTTIMAVRCGSVWGVEQNALDVSYVVRYALPGADWC